MFERILLGRPKAGAPPQIPREVLAVRVVPDVMVYLDLLCADYDLTRPQVVELLLLQAHELHVTHADPFPGILQDLARIPRRPGPKSQSQELVGYPTSSPVH